MSRIVNNTQGVCAMVRLASSLIIETSHARHKCELSLDPTVGSPTYIDAIGIPHGVRDEHKLADQIAAGFGLTRDTIEGLAEQLVPTSLMAVQNCLALDMLLAVKGGIWSMFGDVCCKFIPNNTTPNGREGHGRSADLVKGNARGLRSE